MLTTTDYIEIKNTWDYRYIAANAAVKQWYCSKIFANENHVRDFMTLIKDTFP